MSKIIECENITHYYGNRLIYENLSFDVEQGKVLGLLGKNGTGENHHHQYPQRLPEASFGRVQAVW